MGGDIPTEDEIAHRIAKDRGALDEEVVLKRSSGGARHIYHDADDPCYDFESAGYRTGPEKVTRAEAQNRGLAPCKRCIVGFDNGNPGRSLYERAKHFDAESHDSLADVSPGGDD